MKILIVSPYFAPSSLVGAQRMTSLARYLADHGHEVHVVSLTADTMERTTDASCHSVPPENVVVHPFDLPVEKANVFANESQRAVAFMKVLEQLLKEETFDGILMTLGPFFPLHTLQKFAKEYNLPYVLDFRDLGSVERMKNDTIGNYIRTHLTEFYTHRTERSAVKDAAYITVVCPGDVERMQKAYKIPDDRICCIFNGYDEERLKDLHPQSTEEGVFKIGVFGKFMIYNPEKGPLILKAVDRLRKEGVNAKIVHVGVGRDDVLETVQALGVDPACYEGLGIRDYKEGVEIMSGCDMFAMDYVHPTGLGTKIFDYIHLNKPVLAVAPKDIHFSEFVSQFENCFLADTEEDVYQAFRKVHDQGLKTLDKSMDVDSFSRRHQNKRFEELLIRCFNTRP